MGEIYQATLQFLKDDEWPHEEIDAFPALRTAFEGQNARWDCFARPLDDDDQLIFYSLCPELIPVNQRAQVMEYITRANFGLRMGNFEMNPDDGELRFKTSLDAEGVTPPQEMIKAVIYGNVTTMDIYLPGVLAILHADATPIQALSDVEALPTALA